MEVRVLGPVEVWHDDVPLSFARRQQRLILGILALEANQLVLCDRLIDLLWEDHPPSNARPVVQSRISELRNTLNLAEPAGDTAMLVTHGSGYVLRISPEHVDAHRFREVAANWRTADSEEHARLSLRGALGLWRGPALGGWLAGDSYNSLCQGLESARLTAAEDLFDLELRLGRHLHVVDEIVEVATANPTRERLTGQMMLALHRTGRSAEALNAYDRWRRWLGNELGINPGSDLQQLHFAILNDDPSLSVTEKRQSSEPAPETAAQQQIQPLTSGQSTFQIAIPRLLPPITPDFVGRADEITLIRDVLTSGAADGTPLVAVCGRGGVGKTTLSVQAAHALREQFPDGQLHVNLRGVDLHEPVEPFDVLGRFLRALGVDGMAIPNTLDERADMYRDLLSERRILVILDNANGDDQIAPLIPGNVSCAVIVNSRVRLGATLGARILSLDVLHQEQAVSLLSRIAGGSRTAAEPDACCELARHCGNLPLALRVVGAKLAAKPHWSVEKLVRLLADEHSRLNHFAYGHLDVRASIGLSYSGLPAEAQMLLRRLGDIDLPEATVWASAALLDTSPPTAESILELLVDAQLIDPIGRDTAGYPRYRMHDLVRLFAKESAEKAEPADGLESARTRVFGSCLHIVDTAYRALEGGDYRNIWGSTPRRSLDDNLAASLVSQLVPWFKSERYNIVTIIRRAVRDGHGAVCWELACTIAPLFDMLRDADELQTILELALTVTEQTGDDRGRAAILYRTAGIYVDRREHDQARELLQQAADLLTRGGDNPGHANVSALIATIDRFRGDREGALTRYEQALSVLDDAKDYGAAALVLRGIGQIHVDCGRQQEAEACFDRALEIYRLAGARQGQAQVLFWRGMLRLQQQRHDEAEAGFQEALATCRTMGDVPGQAQCLRGLGLCHQQRGNTEQARRTLLQALELVLQPGATLLEGYIRQAIDAL